MIVSYDLTTGEVGVLHRRDNGDRYVNESLDFHIGGILGSRAWPGGAATPARPNGRPVNTTRAAIKV